MAGRPRCQGRHARCYSPDRPAPGQPVHPWTAGPGPISTHGFARDAQFQVSEQGPTALSFQLKDSEETRRVPFSFVLTVTYTLEGSRLKAHQVENRSAVPMLYELGGHDGFRTPLEPGETMADYAVTISGVEELRPTAWTAVFDHRRGPLSPGGRAHPPCPPGPSGWTPLSWTWRGGAPGCPGGPLRPGAGGGGVSRFSLSGTVDGGQAL